MKMGDYFALPLRACAHGGGAEDANADTALVTVSTKALEDYDRTSIAAAHAINCHDAMLEALELAAQDLFHRTATPGTYPKVLRAINKAKGE